MQLATKHLTAFAPATPNLGELNQLRGVLLALTRCGAEEFGLRFVHNLDMCLDNVNGRPLKRHLYADEESFGRDYFASLDAYFARHLLVPRVFVVACTQDENENAAINVEAACRTVKKYYAARGLGKVVTAAVNSRPYKYLAADVVHIAGHLLTDEERRWLENDEDMRKKVFVSEGIIHNMSRTYILQKYGQPKMRRLLAAFENGRPNVVFALGGRVNGDEIRLTTVHAAAILEKLAMLQDRGFNVIVTNGPRTPNDVTDYFYEQSLVGGQKIAFYNSKPVARTAADRTPEKWRIYSGRHEAAFLRQASNVGNVWPAVLGLPDTLAVHTFDSFAGCETAASGIPTAICRQVSIDRFVRPDCYRLAEQLISGGYAVDFEDFDGRVLPRELGLKTLPNANMRLARKIAAKTAAVLSGKED